MFIWAITHLQTRVLGNIDSLSSFLSPIPIEYMCVNACPLIIWRHETRQGESLVMGTRQNMTRLYLKRQDGTTANTRCKVSRRSHKNSRTLFLIYKYVYFINYGHEFKLIS